MADPTSQHAGHPQHKAATGATAPPGRVDPSLYLHPQTLSRLGSFELRAKMIIEGVMSGQHRSPYAGVSVEFAQHRGYTPGDDLRHLDWKVFARTDRLQIKQYQQETNLDLVVLVDSSGSMNFGTRTFASASGDGHSAHPSGRTNWTKFDHATGFAAALAYVTIHQGDRVGMGTPLRMFSHVLDTIAKVQGNSEDDNAELFAKASVALADAGIVAWDAKFQHDLWRPVTGIRDADLDGNPLTDPDPDRNPSLRPRSL